ncbi:MAG: hypothetical protein IT445_14965 [Phycisphaeraceae bacterium]|nr:hypothetical protein [Phycisphaeraceae bacterium]
MNRTTALIVASMLTFAACFAHAEVMVTPIALTVGSPTLQDMDFDFRPNGVNPGTSVHVIITGLEQRIVDLDTDNSTVSMAVDSTGKDLLAQPKPKSDGGFSMSMSSDPIGPFPHIKADGSAIAVELITPQAPAAGATSINCEASLAVLTAAGTKTLSAQNVPLQPGQVALGDQSFEITAMGPSDWEEGKFKLTLKMTKDLHQQVAGWTITDDAGAKLTDGPYSTMTMFDTVELEFTLSANPQAASFALDLYDDMQKVTVPVKFQVGLGIE